MPNDANCAMSETHNKCWHCGKELDRPLHTVYINRGIHDDCERDTRSTDLLRIELAQLREQLVAAEAKIARVRERIEWQPGDLHTNAPTYVFHGGYKRAIEEALADTEEPHAD